MKDRSLSFRIENAWGSEASYSSCAYYLELGREGDWRPIASIGSLA